MFQECEMILGGGALKLSICCGGVMFFRQTDLRNGSCEVRNGRIQSISCCKQEVRGLVLV